MDWIRKFELASRRRKLERAAKSALAQAGGDLNEAVAILKTMVATDPDLARAWAMQLLEQIARENPTRTREGVGRLTMRILLENAKRRRT